MLADANLTGTFINIVSAVIVTVVLAVLNRVYKAVSNLLRASKTHGLAIREIIEYLFERDGVRVSARFSGKPPDPDGSD